MSFSVAAGGLRFRRLAGTLGFLMLALRLFGPRSSCLQPRRAAAAISWRSVPNCSSIRRNSLRT